MPITKHAASLASLLALFAVGCTVGPGTVPPARAPAPLPDLVATFAEPLARGEVTVEHGTIRSTYGCTVGYEYFEPALPEPGHSFAASAPLVVLAHGFMRSPATMRGWADEWAARGARTVVVGFCNSGVFSGRHDRNAADLVAVADHLEPGDVPRIYAGFSAGGLSALLAAAADRRTVAYLGLDAVDSNGLAAGIERLRAPALFLAAEASSCNARGTMLDAVPRATRLIALRIPYASHCDFEHPSTRFCTVLCGQAQPPETADEIRSTIRALATAWIEAYAGVSPESQAVFHHATIESLAAARRAVIVRSE